MSVVVDVGNDGVFPVRARRIALTIDGFAIVAIINAQEKLIGINDFGFAIAIEVEYR